MSEITVPWTPEAIAAAGGEQNMTPITWDERQVFHQQPGMYALAGDCPNLLHKDAARLAEVGDRRRYTMHYAKGLCMFMQAGNLADRWYITFNGPDAAHAEEWFQEASGGQDEYFGPHDLEAFIARIDTQPRRLLTETRMGFRVIVYSEPEA